MRHVVGVELCSDIIGVAFWNGNHTELASVPFSKSSGSRTDSLEFSGFQSALRQVQAYLERKYGIGEAHFVLCVPDCYGLKEILMMKSWAVLSNICIDRVITRSDASAYQIATELQEKQRSSHDERFFEFYVTVPEDAAAVFKQYTYDSGVLYTEDAVLRQYNGRGTQDSALGLKAEISVCIIGLPEARVFLINKFKIAAPIESDPGLIREGLALYCAAREGTLHDPVLWMPATPPYPIALSVGGQSFPLLGESCRLPTRRHMSLPLDCLLHEKISVREQREGKYVECGGFQILPDALRNVDQRTVSVGIDIGNSLADLTMYIEKDDGEQLRFAPWALK